MGGRKSAILTCGCWHDMGWRGELSRELSELGAGPCVFASLIGSDECSGS